jgi:fermentation-respiration switch protein FrsA (DUF1100 family)
MCGSGENTLHDLWVAANNFPGVKVHQSEWSDELAKSAALNSHLCCTKHRGGHHNWDRRFQALVATGLAKTFGEINSESWKRQEDNNPVELWTEAFRAWKQSKGHWGVASKRHALFGAALEKSSQGLWYMTIVVAGEALPDLPDETNIDPEYKVW